MCGKTCWRWESTAAASRLWDPRHSATPIRTVSLGSGYVSDSQSTMISCRGRSPCGERWLLASCQMFTFCGTCHAGASRQWQPVRLETACWPAQQLASFILITQMQRAQQSGCRRPPTGSPPRWSTTAAPEGSMLLAQRAQSCASHACCGELSSIECEYLGCTPQQTWLIRRRNGVTWVQ